MTCIRKLIERIGPWRVVYISLTLNVVLLIKVAAFDPIVEFKPVCLNTAFGGGFRALSGKQTEAFQEAIRFNLKRYGFRISRDGRNYVSLVTLWTVGNSEFWRDTNGSVRHVVEMVGIKPTLSDFAQYEASHGFSSCELTRAYALVGGGSSTQ